MINANLLKRVLQYICHCALKKFFSKRNALKDNMKKILVKNRDVLALQCGVRCSYKNVLNLEISVEEMRKSDFK